MEESDMYDDLIPRIDEIIKNDKKKAHYEQVLKNPKSTSEEKEEAKKKIAGVKGFEGMIGKF
jgi:hypothetical protein